MASRRKSSKGKTINPTLFIFCEGETEESYINLLKSTYRLPSIHIQAKIGRNNITSEYIENYKQGRPTDDKDIDFLMYDLDVPTILDRLNNIENTTLLVSNPCIELWFLLHYKNQNSNISTSQCNKELQNRVNYKKGVIDAKLKAKLISKTSDAIKRAKKLMLNKNPSSTIYKLIEILEELKNK
jgi:hypothetical protein